MRIYINNKLFITIFTLLFGAGNAMAQTDDKEITVTDEDGKTEQIDIP